MSGVLWAVVAGVGFGFFQIFNRRAGRDIDPYVSTFILIGGSALILTIASIATEDLSLLRAATPATYLNFIIAGLIHFFLGWTLLNISQNRIGASRTSALLGVSPLFATLTGAIFFGEWLSLPALAGVILVVIGVYLITSK